MIIWWIRLRGQRCLQPINLYYISLKYLQITPDILIFFAEGWCWVESMAATSNMRKPPFASAETLFRLFFQDPLELHAMTWNPGIHLSDWSQNCWYFHDRSGCTILWMSGENMRDLWKECLKINFFGSFRCLLLSTSFWALQVQLVGWKRMWMQSLTQ